MSKLSKTPSMQGAMTALVTPFSGGEVDWPRVDALVDRQIEAGIDWLVPCGTTGESPTLTEYEYRALPERILDRLAGRVPVMIGTGSNSTQLAVQHTRQAASAGASAALVVAPYYNRPTPEGLYRHFAAVADAADLPIVLYNVPVRTGVDIPNDVVVRLREAFPNIVAIKHATGRVDGVTDLLARCDIKVLSGDDPLTHPLLSLGASGVISVISNLVPSLVKSHVNACREGDFSSALSLHGKVLDLAMGIGCLGPNPLPIKTALACCGWIEEEFRLPLCPLDKQARDRLIQVLRRHELWEPSLEAATL